MKPINSLQFTLYIASNKFCSWLHTTTHNIDTQSFHTPYGGALEIQKPELERYHARTVCRFHAFREITLDSAIKNHSSPDDILDGKAVAFGSKQQLTGILTKNVFTFIVFPQDDSGNLMVRAQCWCECALTGFSYIIGSIAQAYPEARLSIQQQNNTINEIN